MKATINVEYSGEEIEKLVSNLVSKQLFKFVGNFSPEQTQGFLVGMRQALDMVLGQGGGQPQRGRGPSPRYGAPPFGPFGGSFVPPPGFRHEQWGSPGAPQDPPYPQPAGRAVGGILGDQDNVQPIREPGHVDRCFPIEATRHIEAGIGCCACATYNGMQRVHCRNCGHKLCVIETPPPAEEAPA